MKNWGGVFVFIASALLSFGKAKAESIDPAIEAARVRLGKPLTVMTRNLYVGADLFQVLEAQRPEQIPLFVARTFQTIVKNSIHMRVQGFVNEIKDVQPDVVGLQEVSLIRLQSPGDFLIGNPKSAEIVIYDYLFELLRAMEENELEYDVAGQITNADIELPMFVGGDEHGPKLDDVRLTDRDVLLVRRGLQVSEVQAHNFHTNLKLPIGGVEVAFTRGYVGATVKAKGLNYKVVNVHLEVGGREPFTQIQAAQMQELMGALAQEPLPTILTGDFNSSPKDGNTQPYHQAKAAGFVDIWDRAHPFADGFTCCQSPDLENSTSQLDSRIDHIFVRNNLNGRLPFRSSD